MDNGHHILQHAPIQAAQHQPHTQITLIPAPAQSTQTPDSKALELPYEPTDQGVECLEDPEQPGQEQGQSSELQGSLQIIGESMVSLNVMRSVTPVSSCITNVENPTLHTIAIPVQGPCNY